MFVEEVFVEIPGFPNYSVSNYGSVVNTKFDRDLKPQERDGKLTVDLYGEGLRKTFFIHRLVAQAFFVDYDDEVEVYHISKNKQDNCIANLHLVDPVR